MSDEGQPQKPEDVFKKLIWRSTLELSEPMEQATTWSITGIAAIAGLFISNLDSVSKLVSREGIKWSLIAFTASLVAGAVSKNAGMAVHKGGQIIQKLETLLRTPGGQQLMDQMSTPPRQLMSEIAAPFFWPLSTYMRHSAFKGTSDSLSADKRMVKMFCVQLAFVYLHGALAAAGLCIIAYSITP